MTGIVIGLVGSLGYWLQQHEVSRGDQPWYYYLLIQIPIYEFVGMVGALLASSIGVTRWLRAEDQTESIEGDGSKSRRFPAIAFLTFWVLASFLLFTFSGERMPWLTVHIALPLILLAGWGFGQIADGFEWDRLRKLRAWATPFTGLIFILAVLGSIGRLLGSETPFQGKALEQLAATNGFLALVVLAVISGYGLYRLGSGWPRRQLALLITLILIVLGYGLSARAAGMASFINYDQATEFLVYAHGAEGVKDAIQQIEEIAIDTANGLAIEIAYDEDVAWPLNWYLRDYPNRIFYGANLTRDMIGYPLLLVGDDYFSDADALLSSEYEVFDYIRMVWPTQEYYHLTTERITNALGSAEYRHALWDIWFNRDYARYGQLIGRDFSLYDWSPSDRMRLYIRQDIMARMWSMGAAPVAIEEYTYVDPYIGRMTFIDPAMVYGGQGGGPGQFEQPRDIAIGPDGSLYVVDSGNHRIQRLSTDGEVLNVWGSYGDVNLTDAPGGTFNQPWGITVDASGTVYVADTWNHRIQVFTSEGEFIEMFGVFDNPTSPESYWGPRDVHIDSEGNLYVVDTGNKRVVVFNSDRDFIGEFGIGGYALGELDEPVGITVADDGTVFLADTWNLRIQVFEEIQPGDYIAIQEWEIDGWLGQSLDNKPYMAIYEDILCTTDPEGYRVLCFNPDGEFLFGWAEGSLNSAQFGVLSGLAFDDQGGLWVTDSTHGRLYYFSDIPSHVIIDT
jgi:sugar lactone lactonase YvrE